MVALFTDESQLFDLDGAWVAEAVPSFAGGEVCLLCLLLGSHFDDGHVRHVRPLFLESQTVYVELIVEVAQTLRGMAYADEDRWGGRDESFHFSQGSFEGFHLATDVGHGFQSGGFTALQRARRKNSDVCGQMRQFRMQFAAEALHKLPYRILYVRHQCIPARSHDTKLYARQRDAVR